MVDVRVRAERLEDLVARKEAAEERTDLGHILGLHLAETGKLRGGRHRVLLHETRDGGPTRQRREANVHQLGRVQVAVVVSARAERRGEHNTSSVHRLPDVDDVDAARHLLDEHGRETLRAKLLVHTEEVDLGGVERAEVSDVVS